MYDYLVVGAGLYGATIAQQMREKGKSDIMTMIGDETVWAIFFILTGKWT